MGVNLSNTGINNSSPKHKQSHCNPQVWLMLNASSCFALCVCVCSVFAQFVCVLLFMFGVHASSLVLVLAPRFDNAFYVFACVFPVCARLFYMFAFVFERALGFAPCMHELVLAFCCSVCS
jgi:hypothetical protein